jgi:Zn-dependent oligopeptidase
MDISEQIEKRVRLDEINHEIASLNKKYETNVNKDGLLMVSDPEDKARLDSLLKMKEELEEALDKA